MQKLMEKDHAEIIMAFYRELSALGEQGRGAFVKAAQLYGEGRGRRMSLRALRDGNPLDFTSYFAYGEWKSTPGAYDMVMSADAGLIDERVTRCPWATAFAQAGLIDCGEAYCHEIDAAIVRGFNPALDFSLTCTQHRNGKCQFYYRGAELTQDAFEAGARRVAQKAKGRVVLPFSYHCAHLYFTFVAVVRDVFCKEADKIITAARVRMLETMGAEAVSAIDAYDGMDFNGLPLDGDIDRLQEDLN